MPKFHGDNTGANPVGDANRSNGLDGFLPFARSERDAIVTFDGHPGFLAFDFVSSAFFSSRPS